METLIGRIRGILDAPAPQTTQTDITLTEEPEKQKPIKKAESVYFGEAVCTACGGDNLTLLPKRVLRQGPRELATMLLIPLFGIICCVVVFFLFALFMPYNAIESMLLVLLLGLVGGCVWGDFISKNIVKRKRIREHLSCKCYRCNSCKKIFLHQEDTK